MAEYAKGQFTYKPIYCPKRKPPLPRPRNPLAGQNRQTKRQLIPCRQAPPEPKRLRHLDKPPQKQTDRHAPHLTPTAKNHKSSKTAEHLYPSAYLTYQLPQDSIALSTSLAVLLLPTHRTTYHRLFENKLSGIVPKPFHPNTSLLPV